jgi:hypothetical protein
MHEPKFKNNNKKVTLENSGVVKDMLYNSPDLVYV